MKVLLALVLVLSFIGCSVSESLEVNEENDAPRSIITNNITLNIYAPYGTIVEVYTFYKAGEVTGSFDDSIITNKIVGSPIIIKRGLVCYDDTYPIYTFLIMYKKPTQSWDSIDRRYETTEHETIKSFSL